MTYAVHVATDPSLRNADYDPRNAPHVGSARTIKEAVSIARKLWTPGWAFTIRDKGNRCVRTMWEDGKVS
jgi:hypothetical protein